MSTSYTKQIIGGGTAIAVAWKGLDIGEAGDAFDATEFASCAVQVAGDFAGGLVQLEASLDGDTFVPALDMLGAPVRLISARSVALGFVPAFIRPTSSASRVTVTLLLRK